MPKIKFALMSVYDKEGIATFAKVLSACGYGIIATDGTGRKLAESGISFIPSADVSGNPAGFEDCIKTISYRIQAGILFDRRNSAHLARAEALRIESIDVVVCNFVSLDESVREPSDFCIANVDVGGPLLVRAAATNYRDVLVVVDPADYDQAAKAISEGTVTQNLRRRFAAKAFAYTSNYDSRIVDYLST
jgi:phosphoribosylaminoimidazolecarboxamide formyltransferase/IMP cyclohydrolase